MNSKNRRVNTTQSNGDIKIGTVVTTVRRYYMRFFALTTETTAAHSQDNGGDRRTTICILFDATGGTLSSSFCPNPCFPRGSGKKDWSAERNFELRNIGDSRHVDDARCARPCTSQSCPHRGPDPFPAASTAAVFPDIKAFCVRENVFAQSVVERDGRFLPLEPEGSVDCDH